MASGPIPIALALESDLVLRGHEFSVDGPPVIFVHDFGEDLDAWVPLTSRMAGNGFRVISMELRGHGLSSGEPDPSSAIDDLRQMLTEIRAAFGPVGLVTHGHLAHASLFIDGDWGAPVQIAVSPAPVEDLNLDIGQSKTAMRMIVYGADHAETSVFANDIYAGLRGQKLLVSTAADETGPKLLRHQPQLFEQMTTFLRRYLIGHHLAFIADHADQIAARAAQAAPASEPENE